MYKLLYIIIVRVIIIYIDKTDKTDKTDKIEMNEKIRLDSDENAEVEVAAKIESEEETLKKIFQTNKCDPNNIYSNKECNKFLLKRELVERKELTEEPESDTYLYPNLNDPNFIIKIAEKKEFNDTKYDGELHEIKEHAELLSKADFEMAPHQAFVRNFLSFQTPYNSLLLYHGLGSGKTLSSIGVCEEMREYMKNMGINKKIIIVASSNVQDNFRTQLFDERGLKNIEGVWTMNNFIGSRFLKEVNPMNMKDVPREKIISQVKTIINASYSFFGYGEFANYIRRIEQVKEETRSDKEKELKRIRNLKNEFNGRLIVIDEVHNIRIADDNENKKVAIYLTSLVKSAENMRLLLLSATPMYNSYKEIIWLLNLMNMNDRRGLIEVKDIFDQRGNFKKGGEELLARKASGYVSFVRGENPYTFPFRIFPDKFAIDKTFKGDKLDYPTFQMNGMEIKDENKLNILASNVYLTQIGSYQLLGYQFVIDNLRKKKMNITTKTGIVRDMPSFENMESFGYTLLQLPLQALNIVYPVGDLEEIVKEIIPVEEFSDGSSSSEHVSSAEKKALPSEGEKIGLKLTRLPSSEKSITSLSGLSGLSGGGSDKPNSSSSRKEETRSAYIHPGDITGTKGLERTMDFEISTAVKGSFKYKPEVEKKYGRIFSPEEIGKYSAKIKNICESIVSGDGKVSDGVILIYSQYIDGGLLPMALALEEMGFTRFSQTSKSLMSKPLSAPVDVRTMKPRGNPDNPGKDKENFIPAKYAMITGDVRISPNNNFEVKALTNNDNKDGHKVKVVLISKAGSEGIDFKFIRQIHVLEPWYNMNRIEQIIGRGVRNFSHKDLPFEKRNVQIFMYGTLLEDKEEAADVYVYRVAESKALQIGKISRLLKETSVDCILNYEQNNFTQEMISKTLETKITQVLSDGVVLKDFEAGDAPFSAACDYMENCQYKCRPFKKIAEDDVKEDTYNESFIVMNSEKIIQKIKELMKEQYFYKKKNLIDLINHPKKYPLVQIYSALTYLIENSNSEFLVDKFGRSGYLINIDEYYLFQPSELSNPNISIYERSVPLEYKTNAIKFEIKEGIAKTSDKKEVSSTDEVRIKTQEDVNVIVTDKTDKTDKIDKKDNKERQMQKEKQEKILQQLKQDFDLAREYTKPSKKIITGDESENIWYKYCGIIIRKMAAEGVPLEYLLDFLVEHIIDMMSYKDKKEFLNYLYSLESVEERTFENMAKNYLNKKIIQTENGKIKAIVLYDSLKTGKDKKHILKLNEKTNTWIDAEPEDIRDLSNVIRSTLTIQTTDFNKLVGFIDYDDKKHFAIFKVKNMEEKRHKGARCDQKSKSKILDMLNEMFVGDSEAGVSENETTPVVKKYTKENTKGVTSAELCPLQEFTFRYFNRTKKNGKIWFLDPETAKLYGF